MKTNISKAALVIFVMVGIGFSIYVAVCAIVKGPTISALKRGPNPLPLTSRSCPDYHLERSRILMNKIENYKKRLDSLAKTDTVKYQGILKANPQILENIHSIETLFNELIKK